MSRERDLSQLLAGEVDDQTQARLEARIARDPELAREAGRLIALSERLAELPAPAWELVSPAPRGGEMPERESDPGASERLWWRGWPRVALAGLAALVLIVAGVGTGALLEQQQHSGNVATATLRPLPGQPAAAVAHVQLASAERIVVTFRRLPRLGGGRFYEAWLMTSPAELIPVASFRPDAHGDARVQTTLPGPPGAFRYIDVSVQRADAGPGHSGDSVLRGPTAPLTHARG